MSKTKAEAEAHAEEELTRLIQAARSKPDQSKEMLARIWHIGATKLGLAPGDVTSRTAYYGGSYDSIHFCMNIIQRLMGPAADRIEAGEKVDEGEAAMQVLQMLVPMLTVQSLILEQELAE